MYRVRDLLDKVNRTVTSYLEETMVLLDDEIKIDDTSGVYADGSGFVIRKVVELSSLKESQLRVELVFKERRHSKVRIDLLTNDGEIATVRFVGLYAPCICDAILELVEYAQVVLAGHGSSPAKDALSD